MVITGAHRGLGLELTRQYLRAGEIVPAGVRSPQAAGELARLAAEAGALLQVHGCEVASAPVVAAFAAQVGAAVDLLIHNAGVRTAGDDLADLDLGAVEWTFRVHALGMLRVARALLPALRHAAAAKMVNIRSGLGSIANSGSGGTEGYRMSKAALTIAPRSLAQDLRTDRIAGFALSPGRVQTAMGAAAAPLTAQESATGLRAAIDRRSLADSGGFFISTEIVSRGGAGAGGPPRNY